jgi:hypothetical protein
MVAGAVFLVFYQLAPWLTARDFVRDDPRLNLVPAALPDKSVAALFGVRVEIDGFSFLTPWKDIPLERKERGASAIAFLKDGVGILVPDPAADLDSARTIRSIAETNRKLGWETLRPDYVLMAAAMAATSDQVKWWRIPSQNARDLALLEMKRMALHDSGALYTVNSGELRGFQEGNPSVAPYRVHLNLFDGADHHYEIVIAAKENHGPVLSQAEVNAMVASLRPIPRH